MNRFAELLDRLVLTPSRNGKLKLLSDYFRTVEDPDRGLALAAITGDLSIAAVKPAMLRALAYHCGSTGLAFSMHTHQVAVPAWRWRHQQAVAVEPLLKRIAGERILLLSSGGSDWIAGSGKAEKVEGGYRRAARGGTGFAKCGGNYGAAFYPTQLARAEGFDHRHRGAVEIGCHALDDVRDPVDHGLEQAGEHRGRRVAGIRVPLGVGDEAAERQGIHVSIGHQLHAGKTAGRCDQRRRAAQGLGCAA